jgi:hypothetical protein
MVCWKIVQFEYQYFLFQVMGILKKKKKKRWKRSGEGKRENRCKKKKKVIENLHLDNHQTES